MMRTRSIAGPLRRLHEDERGVVLAVFLFVSIVLAILIALMWNTSRLISAKTNAQSAADSAALAAATWNARAVNLATGSNMLVLRNASALVSAIAIKAVADGVPQEWDNARDRAASCAPAPLNQACIDAIEAQILPEAGPYAAFCARYLEEAEAALADNRFPNRIRELHALTRGFVEAVPDTAQDQMTQIADFYGVLIVGAVPGRTDGRIVPPLRTGDAASFENMLRLRRRLTDNLLSRDADFGSFDAVGRARRIYQDAEEAAIILIAATLGNQHYVLSTQTGIDELGPATAARDDYSVFVTASQFGVTQSGFLFEYFFDYPVNGADAAICCAQAEIYNGFDERFAARGFRANWPFRVWTEWGWNWQPRLASCDLIQTVLDTDSMTRESFRRAGLPEGVYDSMLYAIHH